MRVSAVPDATLIDLESRRAERMAAAYPPIEICEIEPGRFVLTGADRVLDAVDLLNIAVQAEGFLERGRSG